MVQFSTAHEYKFNLDVLCFTSKDFLFSFITGNFQKGLFCISEQACSCLLQWLTETGLQQPSQNSAVVLDSFTEVPLQVGILFPSFSLDVLVPGRLKLDVFLSLLEIPTLCHLAMQLRVQVLNYYISELLYYGICVTAKWSHSYVPLLNLVCTSRALDSFLL